MKNKYKVLLPLALSAALLFAGCGTQQASAATESGSAPLQTAFAGSAQTQAAVTDSDAYAEAFSKRDLSGEYDAGEAVAVTLAGSTAKADSDAVLVSGSTVTITAAGTYILSGSLDGSVIVDTSKEDKVQLVLDGASINAETFAAIYVRQADKVFVTLAEGSVNALSNGGSFVQIDDNDVDAVVFAKDDITFNGSGSLQITAPVGSGIVGKDEVTITGGVYTVTAEKNAVRAKDSLAIANGSFTLKSDNDGLHAENSDDETLGSIYIAGGDFSIRVSDDGIHATSLLQIDGGTFDITAAEGLEATYIRINDGVIHIQASDDGVNAAQKSNAYTPTVEINGGELTIVMGAGDTDGVDSNGNLIINGGTIDITGQSAFDYDGTAQYNGGTIVINGQTVNAIPNQMMGGGMMGGPGMGGGMNGGSMNGGGMNGGPGMGGRGGMGAPGGMNGSGSGFPGGGSGFPGSGTGFPGSGTDGSSGSGFPGGGSGFPGSGSGFPGSGTDGGMNGGPLGGGSGWGTNAAEESSQPNQDV